MCRFVHQGHQRPSTRPKDVLLVDFSRVSLSLAIGRSNVPVHSTDGKQSPVLRQHPPCSSTFNVPCFLRAPTMCFAWHQTGRLGILVARHPNPLLSPNISRCFEPSVFPIKTSFRSDSPFDESRSSLFANQNPWVLCRSSTHAVPPGPVER